MHLTLLQKEQLKKQQNKLVIWLVLKHPRIVQSENIGFDREIPRERHVPREKRQTF